jgi:hypothetical protein
MPTGLDVRNLLNTLQSMQGLVADGTVAAAALKDAYTRAQGIAAAGRDPTPQEWDDLNAQVATLHQQLQS